ncbi:4Fe-4S dicluster domain-containing protein [Megalodesulfovibrio paquesii]
METSSVFFTVGLWLSLAACLVGFGLRVRHWRGGRLPAFRPLPQLKALVCDALLQLHLARKNPLGWGLHLCIFIGFMGLLLFHAMDGLISVRLLPGYESTLNPYQWLRNALGLLLLLGLALAGWRRLRNTRLKTVTHRDDWFALALLAAIALTGFVLEACKITSERVYARMVEDYANTDDPAELAGLQLVWAREYGVVFARPVVSPEGQSAAELYSLGKELDELVCASCHAPTATAFVSHSLALALAPVAARLDAAGAVAFLWHVHVLCCFAGLLYLPWGKMAHAVFTPLQLVAVPQPHAAESQRTTPAQPTSVPHNLALDACTHCGACSVHCSVHASYAVLGNLAVLPSEKLALLRRVRHGGIADPHTGPEMFRLAEGNGLCTECHRCTDVCPARIDLQSLWIAAKRSQSQPLAEPAAHSPQEHMAALMASRTAGAWAAAFAPAASDAIYPPLRQHPAPPRQPLGLTARAETFWGCVQCTTCTNVCTVVAAATDPVAELDLMPQQIMNLVRMGLIDHTLGARMVWSCVTCYKCQEHCPQGVRVADVLYELRNMAAARIRAEALGGQFGGQADGQMEGRAMGERP